VRRRRSLLSSRWGATIRRLDHTAAWVNPVLMIVVAYLLIFDLSGFVGRELSRLLAVQSETGGKDDNAFRPAPRLPLNSRGGLQ